MDQAFPPGRPEESPPKRAPASEPQGQRSPVIADHELLRRISRGSYGEVWLARTRMGVYRAVKIIYRSSFSDSKPFERELSGIRRFEPISRSHEGFIDILHVGFDEEQGCFYYVMELGDDQSAGQKIDVERYAAKTLSKEILARDRLPAQECLQLGLALSYALAELHKQGLVHRDVKPSNIIFVNGVPKLADIGLVADINEARSFVGTEGFIPPEGPGTPQADVYGLGKVLYEALTGRDRQDYPELPTLREEAPEHERLLELNEIILKACHQDLSRRYPTAWEMHAELVVLANGKSVKRLRLLERRFSQAKRVAAVALIVGLLVSVFGYQAYQNHRVVSESRQRQVGANIAYGNRAMQGGDLLGSLAFYTEALRLEQDNPQSTLAHRLRLGCVLAQCPKLVNLWFSNSVVECTAFSPDGSQVLVVQRSGRSQLLDAANGQPLFEFNNDYGGVRGAFSPDGQLVVTTSEDKTACVLWSTKDGNKVLELPHPRKVFSAQFSPDGSRIVTGCGDHIARVWRLSTQKVELELKGHTDTVLYATFSRDGTRIITASRDSTARLWSATNGLPLGAPLLHPSWVRYADFSPDGQWVATACSDHNAYVWDTASGRRVSPNLAHHDEVRSVQFSPDGRIIVTASLDDTVRLWDAKTHQPLNPNGILRHSDRVTSASFATDGHRIVTGCIDGTVRIWDLAGAKFAQRRMASAFSEDGSAFLTVTNQSLQVWQTVSQQALSPVIAIGASLQRAVLSHDGQVVLTISTNQHVPASFSLTAWKSSSGQSLGPVIVLNQVPTNLIVDVQHGRLLTTAGAVAQLWDLSKGCELASVADSTTVAGAALSRDGSRAVCWSGNTARVWDTSTGKSLFPALQHPFPVEDAKFSPNGTWLVTCGADTELNKCYAQLWDAASGQPVGPRLWHGDGVVWASFSPDARRLATAGEDYVAMVWDPVSGRAVTPALHHENQVWTAVFDENGRCVATASSDKNARVWDAQTGDPITPWLQHDLALRDARFIDHDRHLLALDKNGGGWVWELPFEDRPVAELMDLCRLFCVDASDLAPAKPQRGEAPLSVLWRRLRSKYPASFSTSTAEIEAWHEAMTQTSEAQGDLAGALFHLQHLLQVRTNDTAMSQRVSALKEKLRAVGHSG